MWLERKREEAAVVPAFPHAAAPSPLPHALVSVVCVQYIHLAGGITLESEYPYASDEGDTHDCKKSKARYSKYAVTVDNYYQVMSEKDMVNYVQSTGPLSVIVCAEEWSTYQGGVVTSCCTDLDHAVQVRPI